MSDYSVPSTNKSDIILTEERQDHISRRHPEFTDQWNLIMKVIEMPDEIYNFSDEKEEFAAIKKLIF